ncbi:MAG TPA: Crp/Fnr family transcriptional regulator [Polyangia bacterium]|jgi:CRP/FNR family transcriptional regulator
MTIDIESLRGVSWLAELDEPARFELSGAVEENVARGAVIVRANEPSRAVFIVREGGVKEVQTTPEGKEVILALHGPGDLFGDLAPWHDGGAAPAAAIALIQSKVLSVPRESWERVLDAHPEMQRALRGQLARRITDAWRLVRMLSRYTTEARLKSALLLLAERWGQPREEGIEIALDLTHRTLADLAGASREKVTRALGILQQKGLVQVVRRRLVVPSLDRLVAE